MEIAAVVRGRATIARDLGPGTSMTAEWLALIHALRLAHAAGLRDIALVGDAAAVVAQANGTARVPAAHREHHATFHALAAEGPPPRIRHVKRAQNLAGIALERLER